MHGFSASTGAQAELEGQRGSLEGRGIVSGQRASNQSAEGVADDQRSHPPITFTEGDHPPDSEGAGHLVGDVR